MNRKDFELIARVLKTTKPVGPSNSTLYAGGWRMTAEALAELVPSEGRARFLKACGVADVTP